MPPDDFPLFAEFFNKKLKERGYTLKQLAEISGISPAHLEQFAHGRFEKLPPTPYLRGYFMRLGAILGFDPAEWWERVRQDAAIARSGKADALPRNRFHLKKGRIFLPLALVLLFALAYGGFRAAKIIGKPELTVTQPSEDLTRVAEGHVFVAGSVENGDEVDVNGEVVPLDADHAFAKTIALAPGMNSVAITAKKILGRSTTITKQVYYDASPITILIPEAPSSTMVTSTVSSTP